MSKLGEFLSISYGVPRAQGRFGIEIETEVISSDSYPPGLVKESSKTDRKGLPMFTLHKGLSYWLAVKDGSLRDYGVEYYLKKPLDLPDVAKALGQFENILGDVPFIENSPSTSVHVHINIQDLTAIGLFNLITLFLYFEPVLGEFCGEQRKTNLYCLPYRSCITKIDQMITRLNSAADGFQSGWTNFDSSDWKYLSLNLSTICQIGSVEVRTLDGTTDISRIMTWVGILQELYNACQRFKNPSEILEKINELAEGFLESIFGDYSSFLRTPKTERLLSENLLDVAYFASSGDWEQIRQANVMNAVQPISKAHQAWLETLSVDVVSPPVNWTLGTTNLLSVAMDMGYIPTPATASPTTPAVIVDEFPDDEDNF